MDRENDIMFKNKTITSIHIWGMLFMSPFVVLFITLAIYEEYNDFERDASNIRKEYILNQKSEISYDINRVLKFIQHSYKNKKDSMDKATLQKEIMDTIEYLYGRQDGTGYIFIYDFDGINISDSMQSNNLGKNLYKFVDSDGVEVVRELINISQKPDGGFVKYKWLKPTTGEVSNKISYAKSFEPWGWTVGTGVYLDEVEKLILTKRLALKKRLIKFMMEIFSISVIFFGLGTITLSIVNGIINKEIDTFSKFFKKASRGYTLIEEKQIDLLEFKKMVGYVNSMVTEIHKRKDNLKKLNQSLEKSVEEKTEELKELVQVQDSFIKHSIHEINTPLAVIMTYIDIFKMKYGENRYISKIEAGAKIISTIYDDLAYMVKKDRLEYDKEDIDFSTFLIDRVEFFEEIASGNYHKIISIITPSIDIYFNTLELQRVIDNNISNAIKFGKRDTDIVVKLKQKKQVIILSFESKSNKITDTKQIFEPFHREASDAVGFGLGLEIVRSICDKEGIEVEVSSDENITIFEYRFVGEE
ncbi:MAG: cache domain-containing protein [Sulfurovum sp.]